MNLVTINKEVKYLSEVITDFPTNCIFDKGKVGAGATTIALTNNENYIIAVPFVSLIENKVAQHKSTVLGVYNLTTSAKIKSYLANTKTKKILVTYDSLPKLIEYLDQFGYDAKDFSLLIDEYHLLFTQYSFRRQAVKGVLDNYLKFKRFEYLLFKRFTKILAILL